MKTAADQSDSSLEEEEVYDELFHSKLGEWDMPDLYQENGNYFIRLDTFEQLYRNSHPSVQKQLARKYV